MTVTLAPILKHQTWRHLVADLQTRKETSFLRNIKPADLSIVLAPAATLARWIASKHPSTVEKKALRLLIVGAQKFDAFDHGRWYGLIPSMLGSDTQIQVTLVGPNLMSLPTLSARILPDDLCDVEMFPNSLFYFLESNTSNFDLACLFHPGFEHHHREWFQDRGLASLLHSQTSVIATSYDLREFERDRYIFQAYGYRTNGDAMVNPFHQTLEKAIHGRLDVNWGQVIWQMENQIPESNYAIDQQRIADVSTLSKAIARSATLGIDCDISLCGTRKQVPTSDGNSDWFVHVFNEFLIRENNRQVFVSLSRRLVPVKDISLTEEEWQCYPGEDAPEIERAIWGAKIAERWAERTKKN